MTPIACRTAFRLSLPNTAGWLIHSRLASSSVSRAERAAESIPEAGEKLEVSEWGGDGRRCGISPFAEWLPGEFAFSLLPFLSDPGADGV